jgi:6-phosphofructokinase 2
MKSIYTLTLSPALDKSTHVDHVIPESKLRCAEPKFEPGGGGINVSRAIKKLGGQSVAIYPKGGPIGEHFEHLLGEEGIQQNTISSKNWTRENFIVVETASNRQFRFGMPGSELLESEWKECLERIKDPSHKIDYLVASGSTPPGVPPDFYRQLAKIVNDKGAKLVLDTSGNALKEAIKEGIYLLKPNIRELSEIVGTELNSVPEQEEAALKIIEEGKIEILVVSLGASGAMLASKDGIIHVSAPSVAKKSTVGAGDSMVGGMVLSLSRGMNLLETLQYGVASGTAATMNPGTELCKLEDVEKLYNWLRSAEKRAVFS